MPTRKILFIGGNGYVGSHLASELSSSFEVSAPSRSELRLGNRNSYKFLEAREFDVIVILASTQNGFSANDDVPDLLENNVSALSDFLTATQKKNILYFSSMAVYGKQEERVTEVATPGPVNPYGLSKLLAEEVVRYHGRIRNHKTVTLRVPGVFGGHREGGLLYNAKMNAKSGKDISINVSGLLNWETIEVSDLCKLVHSFLRNYDWSDYSKVFNVGYGHKTDLVQTVEIIVQLLKSKSRIDVHGKCYEDFYQATDKIAPYLHDVNIDFEQSLRRFLGLNQ